MSDFEQRRPPLPTAKDFDPFGGCLDAQCAWEHFGGLTLDEAAGKFRERPDIYQEDFMFMGGKAFAFYFPVIEAHLRDTPENNNPEADDRESWILAKCISNQFKSKTSRHVEHLSPRVIALSRFVRERIARFGYDTIEQQRIAVAWLELETEILAMRRQMPQ